MHELSYTQNFFQITIQQANQAGAKEVTRVFLRVGETHEIIGTYVQKYWHAIAAGSVAENARIEIQEIPLTFQCDTCKTVYPVKKTDPQSWRCPKCGESGSIFTGMELEVAQIEVR